MQMLNLFKKKCSVGKGLSTFTWPPIWGGLMAVLR